MERGIAARMTRPLPQAAPMKPIRTARTNRAEPRPPLQEDQGNANGEDQEYVRAFIVSQHPGGGSPRRNHRPNFRRRFADRSICTNSLGFVIVGMSCFHEIVNTASTPNQLCVDFFVPFTWIATVYAITLDRISGRITRRNTCIPRKLDAVRLGFGCRGRRSRRRSINV